MAELRLTDTNAADDSSGAVWGLEGNLFIPVVVSAMVSIGLVMILLGAFQWHWLVSAFIGGIPCAGTLAYILLFKQGKPPGYDIDLFDFWMNGRGLMFNPQGQATYRPIQKEAV
jgi:hypothetical protein